MARDPLMGVGPHDPPMRGAGVGSQRGGRSVAPVLIGAVVILVALIAVASFLAAGPKSPINPTVRDVRPTPIASPSPIATLRPPDSTPPLPPAAPSGDPPAQH